MKATNKTVVTEVVTKKYSNQVVFTDNAGLGRDFNAVVRLNDDVIEAFFFMSYDAEEYVANHSYRRYKIVSNVKLTAAPINTP